MPSFQIHGFASLHLLLLLVPVSEFSKSKTNERVSERERQYKQHDLAAKKSNRLNQHTHTHIIVGFSNEQT